MENSKDILFLPVKPKWAGLIMSGKKTLELRKRLPSKGHGARCVIYSSSPRCEVVGTCTVSQCWEFGPGQDKPERLAQACVTRAEFDAYFNDAYWDQFESQFNMHWYALELAHPAPFTKPITLETLRAKWQLEPPQQWRYIDGKTFDEIVEAGR